MGTWHDYCIACGLHFCYPLTKFREEMRECHKGDPDLGDLYSSKFSPMWLEKIFGIDQYEQILDLTYENCDTFTVNRYKDDERLFYTSTHLSSNNNYDKGSIGIACHKSCYNLLQKYLGYKLKYRDLWPLLSVMEPNKKGNLLDILDYGEVEQYQGQWFEEDYIEEDLNLWMLIDPESTDGCKNRDRIISICRPLRNKFVVTAAVNKIQRVWRKHYHRKVHSIIFIQIRWRWIIIRPRYKLCRDRLLNEFLQLTVKN